MNIRKFSVPHRSAAFAELSESNFQRLSSPLSSAAVAMIVVTGKGTPADIRVYLRAISSKNL